MKLSDAERALRIKQLLDKMRTRATPEVVKPAQITMLPEPASPLPDADHQLVVEQRSAESEIEPLIDAAVARWRPATRQHDVVAIAFGDADAVIAARAGDTIAVLETNCKDSMS